jgi:hypothetical protein
MHLVIRVMWPQLFSSGAPAVARVKAFLPLKLYVLQSEDRVSGVRIEADVLRSGRDDELLEQIAGRLSIQESVNAVS